MKVLVADDDATTRAMLCAALTELGHKADAFAYSEEAWSSYQRDRSAMVVLAVDTSRQDSVELCRRIRALDAKRETYLLVLIDREHPEDLAAVLDAGADDYVTKPTTPEQLRARIVIAERRSEQDAARRRAEAELAVARWRAGIGETAIALQHEINNPLAAIIAHAELLLMEMKDRGETSEQAETVLQQALRIAEVVRRIAGLRNPKSVEYLQGARMLDLSRGEES